MDARRLCSILTLLVACGSGKSALDEPEGAARRDARLITDVYTWNCVDGTTGDEYQGVFAQNISLEYAPNGLQALDLPSPGGCSSNLDMFPVDAGGDGREIPDLSGRPRWTNGVSSGELSEENDGFYADDVFNNVHQCQDVALTLGSGTTLSDAGVLTDLVAPSSTAIPNVTFDGLTTDESTGAQTIEWGDEIVAAWEENEWDEVWVQIRREREGEAWESVTCNATGEDSFSLNDEIWGLLDESLNVEQNNLYVAFQRSAEQELDSGDVGLGLTRAMAVAVVQD